METAKHANAKYIKKYNNERKDYRNKGKTQ